MNGYTKSLMAGIIVLTVFIAQYTPAAIAAECGGNKVLFLADVSGSMRCESPEVQTTFASGVSNDDKIEKIEVAQELLYRMIPSVAAEKCQTGIFLMRYLSGDPNYYSVFLQTGTHGSQEIKNLIRKEFVTKFPVFNRRTPLADTLRSIDEEILEPVAGKMTVVLISDGKDSFYSHDKDVAHKGIENTDKVVGPVSEVERLRSVYGETLSIHTVYVAGQNNETAEEGRTTLEMMAAAGKGGNFTASELLEDELQLTKFTRRLCCE